MRIRGHRKGFTLVEMLVAFTLTVLLFGLLFQFLVPALKISSRTTVRAETQQQATLALRTMTSEIEETSLLGVSFSEDSSVLAVHPVEKVTQNNQRTYADHVVVYLYDQENGQIWRHTWKKSADDPSIESPRRLSDEELASVQSHLQPGGRRLVKDVAEFEFGHSGVGNLIQLPFQARIKMREQAQSGSREFELIRTVSLRNQI